MKEDVLDVLMYLFEHYMYEETEFSPDRESLHLELAQAGFPYTEINKALEWLDGLHNPDANQHHTTHSIRLFSQKEKLKLDVECRGFLLFLEQLEILSGATRELVIDRVMALETQEIDIDQLKWVVLMVLFNQPGQEAAYSWMEELVLNKEANQLH